MQTIFSRIHKTLRVSSWQQPYLTGIVSGLGTTNMLEATRTVCPEARFYRRDWGHARDYVKTMWPMLQQEKPDDNVAAAGRTVSIRDFCQLAFNHIGVNAENHVVGQSQSSFAPPSSGWQLVAEMVDADAVRFRTSEYV